MADDIENQADEEEQPTRKLPIKLILVVLSVVVLGGGGFVGWTMIQDESARTGSDGIPGKKTTETSAELGVGRMFQLQPFVVNLSDPGGKRYLKSLIELEFTEDSVQKELNARLPQLRDLILLHLSSKTIEEVQSVDGKIELKNSLITRINQVLRTGKITNIYFTQFVIQ
jgi:flagellar FliL protein